MKQLLKKLDACYAAIEWADNKSWPEIYIQCHRGDWLLWLFRRTNSTDKRLLILAKGHCANMVRHLMKDERSINAVDTAIAYGNNEATDEDLRAAAYAAYAAYAAADAAAYAAADAAYAAYAAYAADAAAYAAAYAAADAAYAAYAAADAAAFAAADAAYAAALKNAQRKTADIVRKYIPIELWNIKPDQQ